MQTGFTTIRLVMVSAGVLSPSCAELDRRGVADADDSSFGDSQSSLPSAQVKLQVRKAQPFPAGRYGRPATPTAPEGTSRADALAVANGDTAGAAFDTYP